MASRHSRRFLKPLLYTTAAAAAGGSILYISYRPRNIPGSEPAAVPPPRYGEEGKLVPPSFPRIKSREEQIQDLRASGGASNKGITDLLRLGENNPLVTTEDNEKKESEPYDLVVIGGGATGSGIALDAATRGLRVALVERDDFSSGTSSKSTKLVHGGVRYLEKAVWEMDYNQYVSSNNLGLCWGCCF
jgi:glycerol-3-phosphate dehydrogenase